jgi:tetratricopeptide (TPR) repeat protein
MDKLAFGISVKRLIVIANFSQSKGRWPALLASCIIIFAGFAAYHNSFGGGFIFDDGSSITENVTIRHLWPVWDALSPPISDLTVSGRPILNLSLAINYAWGGNSVRGYHVANLAIHILAGLTLLGIVGRTLGLCSGQALRQSALRERFGASAMPLALAVALLWTLHPVQTESVTYVIQRAESLMGLFYLLTLYAFIRGAEARASGWWHGAAVAACLLGMTTKEVVVSAPLLVLLYDRTFVSGSFREAWRRHRWLYFGLAIPLLMLAGRLAAQGGNRDTHSGFGINVSWWAYALTQFPAVARYLALSAWPHPLVFDYEPLWVKRVADVVPQALLVVALVAGTLIALWRRSPLGVAGAWFFAILAPTSLVPGAAQMIVEHRMYLSLAAAMVLLALGIYALAGRRSLVVLLALAAGFGWLTEQRNPVYHNELSLWSDTVAKRPDHVLAHGNLGTALAQAGRLTEAIVQFEEALRLDPSFVDAHSNLGNALLQAGRVTEAITQYEATVRLRPDYAPGHYNLGNALLTLHRPGEAIRQYEATLRLRPDYLPARYNLQNARAMLQWEQ